MVRYYSCTAVPYRTVPVSDTIKIYLTAVQKSEGRVQYMY